MPVYAILNEREDAVKVGFSKETDCKSRIQSLQTANPGKLEVLAVEPQFTRSDEAKLHNQLKKFKTGGGREWFEWNDESKLLVYSFFDLEEDHQHEEVKEDEVCEYCGHTIEEILELSGNEKGLVNWFSGDEFEGPHHTRWHYVRHEIDWCAVHMTAPITSDQKLFDYLYVEYANDNVLKTICVAATMHELVDDDEEDIVYPIMVPCGPDLLVVVFPLEFRNMEVGERYLSQWRWVFDSMGVYLRVFLVNQERQVKNVPHLIGV